MAKVHFTVVGGGWRSEFYFRIAQECPEVFHIDRVVETNTQRGKELEERWGIPVCPSLDQLPPSDNHTFLILSLPQAVLSGVIQSLNAKGYYTLSESFEASSLEELNKFYQSLTDPKLVQVSEQYSKQPEHNARLHLIEKGILGRVTQAYVSSGHGYHGTSLIRHYLKAGFQNCTITGQCFQTEMLEGPGRAGYPEKEALVPEVQQLAFLDFGGTLGFYYFTDAQYFSKIRLPNTHIRGTHGEICNLSLRHMLDHKTPVEYELRRVSHGQGESVDIFSTQGITAGAEWVYRNPYPFAKLSDDEIAVAHTLEKMHDYVMGSDPVYPVEEGCQDQYLSMMIKKAFETGRPVKTENQSWCV